MTLRFIYFLYRVLGTLLFPLLLLYLVARGGRDRRYLRRMGERFGRLPFRPTQRGGVWLHAVSVGEVISAVHLIEQLKNELPGTPVWVSVTTLAGRDLADQRLANLADGIFHTPFDLVWIIRRVLRQLDPAVVVILETEIWPNIWRESKRRDAGLIVINGRISDRAWPRYRAFRPLFRHVVDHADRIYAQSAQDAERFGRLVRDRAKVIASGNLKYDAIPPPPANSVRQWMESIQPDRVWIAASTMPPADSADVDEDDIVIGSFGKLASLHPRLLLVLAPRRPERFDEAAEKLERAGIRFVRRSALGPLTLPGVLLLDTIGELAGLFVLGDVVFMGGTLARRGGHNILEPAYFAKPILTGPHMENFPEIAREFRVSRAVRQIERPDELTGAVDELIRVPGRFGAEAQLAGARQRGATARAVEAIRSALEDNLPREAGWTLLRPIEWLWQAGLTFDRALRIQRQKTLRTPVISIGNLTIGGAGKTPMTRWLAEQLPNVAILTRGYGRDSTVPLVVRPGEKRTWTETGDEAQTLLRSGAAVLGIGANRRRLAQQIEQSLEPDYFVLDDGLQHWPMARDLDIVLVDAQDPLGGGRLIPRGRLREPLKQLARADVLVLTRAEPGRSYRALLELLHQTNPRAPVLRATTEAQGWMRGENPVPELPPGPYAAFCGLANPGSFRQTLARLGIRPLDWHVFPDHHDYSEAEIQALTQGGTVSLLTTEKDWVKIQGIDAPVFWLQTRVSVTEPEFLLNMIRQLHRISA